MVHFAPCTKEITAEGYSQLFIDMVFRHHGIPEVVISERDPRFISRFWKSIDEPIGGKCLVQHRLPSKNGRTK